MSKLKNPLKFEMRGTMKFSIKELVFMSALLLSGGAWSLDCPLANSQFGIQPGEKLELVCTSPGGTISVDGHLIFLQSNLCVFKSAPNSNSVYRVATRESTLNYEAEDILIDDLPGGQLNFRKTERVYPSGDLARSYLIENEMRISKLNGKITALYSYSNGSSKDFSYEQEFQCSQN